MTDPTSGWNGYTEPLDVGDRVRITSTPTFGHLLQHVGAVTEVCPPHSRNVYDCESKSVGPLTATGYTVEGATYSGIHGIRPIIWRRFRLYKLPPDWDDVLNREEERDAPKRVPSLEGASD